MFFFSPLMKNKRNNSSLFLFLSLHASSLSCTRLLGISNLSIPPAAPEEPVFKTGDSGGRSDEEVKGVAESEAAEAAEREVKREPTRRDASAAAKAGGGVAP
jgi:hypothetical protein